MISNIEIKDVAGGGAPGCTASFTIEHEQSGFTESNYIVAEATPAVGYVFKYWEYDYEVYNVRKGVPGETDYYNERLANNPSGHHIYDSHSFVESYDWHIYRTTTHIAAVFERTTPPTYDSAVYLSLVSNPSGVGSLTGGGLMTGAVGSSVSCSVSASVTSASQGSYRFSHWIDDEGIRRDESQFSKSFVLKSGYTTASPEQKTFTAYFVPYTRLILRSSASGIILRGASGMVLRDE